jgi:hypothetical protein
LIFSPYISKTFQICPTLSVNFKKGPWVEFFDDMSLFLTDVTGDWAQSMLTHTSNTMDGQKCPYSFFLPFFKPYKPDLKYVNSNMKSLLISFLLQTSSNPETSSSNL